MDVVETVNLLVNSNGTVVRSEVVGALKMRTFLSGMPECKLGLNDKASALRAAPTASCSQLFVVSPQLGSCTAAADVWVLMHTSAAYSRASWTTLRGE